MARPQTAGIAYFPVVTEWDQKLKLVRAKYQLIGVGCIIELWRAIYREGYALAWDEDAELLFADENNIDLPTLREILNFAIDRGIFDRQMLTDHHILTSHGVQKQWLAVVRGAHRKTTDIPAELCLLTTAELSTDKVDDKCSDGGVSSRGNDAAAANPPEETPQSKAKQSKLKQSKKALAAREILSAEDESELFLFALQRAKTAPGVRNVSAYAEKIMREPDIIADFLASKSKEAEPARAEAPDPCPHCGKKTIKTSDHLDALCPNCKTSWTYDHDNDAWIEDPEKLVAIPNTG